ncbi:uncharacterized protein PpBr36_10891 [Pyricularia pennisetigena]|uniref:uncharacterized protein n=1 Tax=Pyricularia pennisetigena TaxID=1578925 RepID=UPI001154E5D4|nr:uncharacterized protein PpBr36_10891 [Pyricularia pennisetigena]TLS20838.1 hypothetical protein PpBr36_10891 [Pyricularia pennisetigena]
MPLGVSAAAGEPGREPTVAASSAVTGASEVDVEERDKEDNDKVEGRPAGDALFVSMTSNIPSIARRKAVRTASPKPRRSAGSTKVTLPSHVRLTVTETALPSGFFRPSNPNSASTELWVMGTGGGRSGQYSAKNSSLTFSLYTS